MQRISESTIEYVCSFISQPAKLWQAANHATRQMYQQLLFPNGITYDIRQEKFGTEGLSLFYRLETNKKAPLKAKDAHLVNHRGIQVETLLEVMEAIDPKLKALGIVSTNGKMAYIADTERADNV